MAEHPAVNRAVVGSSPASTASLIAAENKKLKSRNELDKPLKPCPFCGCADVKFGGHNAYACYWVYVFCLRCETKGPPVLIGTDETATYHAIESTRKRWNSRGYIA